MASAPPADPLAVLAGLYLDSTLTLTPASPPAPTGVLVRLASLPPLAGPEWRLEYSLDNGSSWSTPEPHKPGYPTPQQAIDLQAPLISSLQSTRSNNDHVEVSKFFTNGKLKRESRELKNEFGAVSTVVVFSAQAEDGTWIEDSSPVEAVRKAKEFRPPKPVKPSQERLTRS